VRRRPASLRLRAAVFAVIALGASLGMVGLALDAAYRRSSETDLRQQMETWVYLVLAATEVGKHGTLQVSGDLGDPLLGQPASGVYAHLHGDRDHWSSPSALGQELPEMEPLGAGETRFARVGDARGFFAYQFGLVWELADGSLLPFTVSVLVDEAHLQPRLRAFRAGLWKSLGGAGLVLAVALLFFITMMLRPLRRVAQDVADIEQGRAETLDGPYPRELEPLTRNLDRLLKTEKSNQARYRNALDSLAHSLKTPLAVIRASLQGGKGADREAVEQAVNDMQRLITSRLERAAASTRRTLASPVPVEPAARRLADSLRKVHSQKLKRLDVSIQPGLAFFGEERDLMELLGNLLDNACKYGKGRVRLGAGRIGDGAARPGLWLRVENDGNAVDPQRLERMVQRGVRGDERVEGHGLGLTIVSELVTAYGGDIRFGASELGGVSAEVRIPPA